MRRHKRFVPFKRKLQGKTDYRKRLVLLKSGKPRLVVRKSLNNISTQIIAYETAGDKVLVAATSRELLKLGWTGKRKKHARGIPYRIPLRNTRKESRNH